MTFAAVVRQARKELGITVATTARESGMARTTIIHIEGGRLPSFDSALRLSKYLGFSLDDFTETVSLPGEQ